MIIAQASQGPGLWQVAEHLGLLASILVAVLTWLTYRRKKEVRRIEPDPIRTRKVEPNAKENVCLARYQQLMSAIHDEAKERKTEDARIYDQIDVVERRSEDRLNQSFTAMNETIRKLPGEVIGLLRTTGQLKDHR